MLARKMSISKWIPTSGRRNQEMMVRFERIHHEIVLCLCIGGSILNIRKFWEKLVLAARAIVAVENPADVCAISCQPQGNFSV